MYLVDPCRSVPLVLSSRLSPSRGKPLSGVDLELPSAQGSGLRQLWCEAFDPSLSPVLVESFAPGKGFISPGRLSDWPALQP